jgi:hypothetical protein
MTTAVQRMLLRAFTCKSMRDAHSKLRFSMRLDEAVLAAARVLARQMDYMLIKRCRIYLPKQPVRQANSCENLPGYW